jgi:7,8-dihydropterin-6-yl-methyl-4-(beta-D-ribofuranosyl)aminobenzene 5'-phosphate synthase
MTQAFAFLVKGKGLIVVAGCAHAGIINTIEHARKVTGVRAVHAVMGGFHLSGPAWSRRSGPPSRL